MSMQRRSVTVTVLVFAGLGLLCGALGAVVLWRYASEPFTVYTAGYEPSDFRSIRIDHVSPYGYMAALTVGGALSGAICGALAHRFGWGFTQREHMQ